MLTDWTCVHLKDCFFPFFKVQLDTLNFVIFAALIIYKGSPWAREKMMKLDVFGVWKGGLVSSVSLQMVPLENLGEVSTCAGSCTWECI